MAFLVPGKSGTDSLIDGPNVREYEMLLKKKRLFTNGAVVRLKFTLNSSPFNLILATLSSPSNFTWRLNRLEYSVCSFLPSTSPRFSALSTAFIDTLTLWKHSDISVARFLNGELATAIDLIFFNYPHSFKVALFAFEEHFRILRGGFIRKLGVEIGLTNFPRKFRRHIMFIRNTLMGFKKACENCFLTSNYR